MSGTGDFLGNDADLVSFLLVDYLARLGDPRLTEVERFERRMKLEYQLWRLDDGESMTPYQTELIFRRALAGEVNATLFPAVEWYFDFLSGKSRRWLSEFNAGHILRLWRQLPVRRLRERAIATLLFVEAARNPDDAGMSEIPELYREEEALERAGRTNNRKIEITEVLLREALVAPPFREGFPDLRRYAIRTLRYCLTPSGVFPDRDVAIAALNLADDIGEETFEEFYRLLIF